MGSRGPLAKPPEEAQGHRKRELQIITGSNELKENPPKPTRGWLKQTRDRWYEYWKSDVAGVAQRVDLPAAERLFGMYDQYARVQKVVKKSLVVRGSTGQIRTNPLAEHALKLENQILRLENELGLTPMARQRLGIAVGEAATSLASINDLLNQSDDPATDPRILELLAEDEEE